jgi:hypothetical protein
MGTLGQIATGLQIATPASTIKNLLGGISSTYAFNDMKAVNKAFMDMAADRKGELREAIEVGAIDLGEDFLQMSADAYRLGIDRKVAGATRKALQYAQFDEAEKYARLLSYLTAKASTADAIRKYNKNPTSADALRFKHYVKQQRFNLDKLLAQDKKETNKWLRHQTNMDQGSYRINQSPLITDTPLGRFFLKYQKWGTQHARTLEQKVINPSLAAAREAVKNKDYGTAAVAITPILRYGLAMAIGGTAMLETLEALFDRENPQPAYEDFFKGDWEDRLKTVGKAFMEGSLAA